MDERTLEALTLSQCINGIYTWDISNPIYFRVVRHLQRPFDMNLDIIEIQIRFNNNLRRALKIHKCWIYFTFWTTLTPSAEGSISRFRFHVMNYLDQLGVISINNVIRAAQYFYARYERHIVQVGQKESIQLMLY